MAGHRGTPGGPVPAADGRRLTEGQGTGAEREWREASDMRVPALGVVLVIVVAAVLRLWSLGQGIPFSIGVDEPEGMGRVVRMMKSGD